MPPLWDFSLAVDFPFSRFQDGRLAAGFWMPTGTGWTAPAGAMPKHISPTYRIILMPVIFVCISLNTPTARAIETNPCRIDFGPENQCRYRDKWFYTLDEINSIYAKEYHEEKRLHNRIHRDRDRYVADCNRSKIDIPETFVNCILKHLAEMLRKGYARFLFRLDACHGHLFVSNDAFIKRYQSLNFSGTIKMITNDKNIGVLYHNAEHLALRNPPKTGKIDPRCALLRDKRNVIGWCDGRPVELTYPKSSDATGRINANTAGIPDGFCSSWAVNFKANKNGEFVIRHGKERIRVDLSLCNFYYY